MKDINNTFYEAKEPLQACPVNGYKTVEEVIEVLNAEYTSGANTPEYATKEVLEKMRSASAPLSSKICHYLVKATYTKKNGGYKIVNGNVLSDLVHSHPLNTRTQKRPPEYKRSLINDTDVLV
ncbi:unnamed protein product [Rhizopus stolonifer]